MTSSDQNFRPADVEIGPDGAIYFTDWQNPIIGHMQHNLRDPSRDQEHGRVYRVKHTGRDLVKPVTVAGAPIDKLLDLLKSKEDRVRARARIELTGRPTAEVIAAARKWLASVDKTGPAYEHHRLEGLWLFQSHNVVDDQLLRQVLRSPEFRARAAATRVLAAWRDRVPDALDLLQVQVNDDSPRVRLIAIWALSFFHVAKARDIAEEVLVHPTDYYIDYTLKETLSTLDRRVKKK